MGRITDTVKHLLIINGVFFIATIMNQGLMYNLFALWYPGNPNFRVWQLVTHMFMHGGFTHILFNMFNLYVFGTLIEGFLGRNKFLILYFSSGLIAAGLQLLFNYIDFHSAYQSYTDAGFNSIDMHQILSKVAKTGQYNIFENVPQGDTEMLIDSYMSPMLGASGAVFGVMAAAALLYPNLPLYIMFIPIPVKAKYFIGFYFLLTLYSAITKQAIVGPANTAFWAHIGGAVVGFIAMWYWKKKQFNDNRWN